MSTNTTMQAAIVETNDGPFILREIARPTPASRQVLVRVHASGTNPLDTKIRAGQAAHARHPLPAVLGMDLAGVVEKVGSGVSDFAPGDEVYGFVGGVAGMQGSLAHYVAADARLLAHKPANLTMREASILPLVVITAWEGLIDRAQIRPGQTVLVLGGAGGVGHVAVQIALAHGAQVFATAFRPDHDYLRSLGAIPIDAEEPIDDYLARHTGGAGFDVVYDTGGGAMLDTAFKSVRRFGHVVSCLGWGTHALAPLSFRQATYSGVFTLHALLADEGRAHYGKILEAAAALAEGGQLLPRLDPRSFTLAEADAAYDAVLGRKGAERQRGKIAITIA